MALDYIIPEFDVVRNDARCTRCRICETQCANGVHTYNADGKVMVSDESKCVNCQRCVSFCPTHALKIVKNENCLRENANWSCATVKEIYKQASTGGVLLSSMGNPQPLPVYWDRLLINASQVTNPPIDPLREPMETRVFLGKKPAAIRRNADGTLCTDLPPQLELSVPILFSAMSYGSISYNAHAALARAAQELGICYNTGEGGLHRDFYPYGANTIVQVASGRFGVEEKYLITGAAIEIKMGQGAKPGIGGHLPGAKIVGDVSRTRMVPEGSDAISPAPHHDIYSIEDLAQLIYDLKNANPKARISVKLVSEAGVGTIASGVAKAGATVVLISGYDGGTGAASQSSIHHAGLPWELGLAQAHQNLVENGLRSRVLIETDGKLMTGKDVAIACLLGAEEFGFATAPLVTMGCMMMRVCNLDTCPFGVATQNQKLRKRFKGKPEYVMNFMLFIARELREIMADLGYHTINEMVGHTDNLEVNEDANMDYSNILMTPYNIHYEPKDTYDFELEKTVDMKILLPKFEPYFNEKKPHAETISISSTDRTVGTILSSVVTKQFNNTLQDDTYTVHCNGGAGQSFGAFVQKGITLDVHGDANDYFGKGLSGGKLIIQPKKEATFKPNENVIIGNVALYGATSGEAYIRGMAGERFAVRNSGASAVVEGVGDHGLEYMTGGTVVILGQTGKNLAAGMSGGIAYIYDPNHDLYTRLNKQLVNTYEVSGKADIETLTQLLKNHYKYTNSDVAQKILSNLDHELSNFKKIVPKDYEKITTLIQELKAKGYHDDEASLMAFEQVHA